jgi:hypothetical protein
MKRAFLAAAALLVSAAPAAQAQLFNIPTYPLATPAEASTFLVGTYGRGLNEDSGKQNAFGVGVGRTGLGARASAFVGASMVDLEPDSKFSFAGAATVGLLQPGAATQVAVHAGVGYISFGTDDSSLSFPIGLALSQTLGTSPATVFVMPRLQITRVSAFGDSATETDFGASGGLAVTTASGFGFHAGVDLVAADPNVWVGGAGIHYLIP